MEEVAEQAKQSGLEKQLHQNRVVAAHNLRILVALLKQHYAPL